MKINLDWPQLRFIFYKVDIIIKKILEVASKFLLRVRWNTFIMTCHQKAEKSEKRLIFLPYLCVCWCDRTILVLAKKVNLKH